ncbi:efflux RND transporter periplasmic adaptor subunit [bacterium AH-315-J19]|nr:efflux RND transporter periplasmic adaptor subunit [Robiginitomaculum sp.]MBN4058542.1 efflux RND transporter periplasmic adaptor subunit [bacterium AH-315-J19]
MKIKRSYLIALGLLLLIAFWFIIGSREKNTKKPAPKTVTSEQTAPTVEIKRINAERHENYMDLYGRTEADREVSVKATTAGLVVRTPVREGTRIKRGTLICAQDVDARQAVLDQANAQLRSRELEYQAAQTLVEKGFRSSTQAAGALALLDGAKAQVKQAQIELGNVKMRAPFSGIFEQQMAEIGDYLAPGQPCGLVVDFDPLVITGEVTEKQVGLLGVGKEAVIKLATGETVSGKIRFIETRANPATRTFRIEIATPNKDGKLKAGVTAEIKLSAGQTDAHLIPASVLTLDDGGSIGVRYLDFENKVRFSKVTTIDETPDGIWVTGLPNPVNLIVRGQDYVSDGVKVLTQYDTESSLESTDSEFGPD